MYDYNGWWMPVWLVCAIKDVMLKSASVHLQQLQLEDSKFLITGKQIELLSIHRSQFIFGLL